MGASAGGHAAAAAAPSHTPFPPTPTQPPCSSSEDTEGERLGRGTQINIFLKDSCLEYLQQDKLRQLVQRYSEFINFPIYLQEERTVEKEVCGCESLCEGAGV